MLRVLAARVLHVRRGEGGAHLDLDLFFSLCCAPSLSHGAAAACGACISIGAYARVVLRRSVAAAPTKRAARECCASWLRVFCTCGVGEGGAHLDLDWFV